MMCISWFGKGHAKNESVSIQGKDKDKDVHYATKKPMVKWPFLISGFTLIESILQWWDLENKPCWELEQLGNDIPLIQWTLTAREQGLPSTNNLIGSTLCKFW